MREIPILFTGEMVRAILEDRKTRTRRIVNRFAGKGMVTEFGKSNTKGYDFHFRDRHALWNDVSLDWVMEHSPWQVGQIRWVREAWKVEGSSWQASRPDVRYVAICYRADGANPTLHIPNTTWRAWAAGSHTPDFTTTGTRRWRPSIHMPRWASRITLEVTDVRVQRVQEISEEDAIAEGVERTSVGFRDYELPDGVLHGVPAEYSFRTLWDSINAKKHPWDSNPYVWAITFKRVN